MNCYYMCVFQATNHLCRVNIYFVLLSQDKLYPTASQPSTLSQKFCEALSFSLIFGLN
jgi:hypothetical protein